MTWIEKLKLKLLVKKYNKKVNADEKAYLLSAIKEGQTVFDIGAHIGAFSYFMHQSVGNNGSVYVFEPQSILYKRLLRNKQLLQWNNVTINHLALSDSTGFVTLYIPSYKGKADTESATTLLSERSVYATETVATETLDNYCKQYSLAPGFLKIDVEGNELKVLQGGIETIKKCSPKIILEVEARHCGKEQGYATFKFLTDMGYEGWFTLKTERIPIKLFNFDTHQVKKGQYFNNFIFER